MFDNIFAKIVYIVNVVNTSFSSAWVEKCQKWIKKRYWKRKRKMIIISRACFNWIWKPICRDNTIGIRLKLDLKHLNDLNKLK